jgi:hypothetical protein
MDIAFAILVGALGIAVALFLAFRSNKVDDQGDNKKNRQQPKKQVSRGPRKIKAIQGPNIRSADSVETEDEEHTMLQFLRGTQEQIAKERKEENRKKARLEKKILEKNPAEDNSESSEEEGDEEYIIIKKKKKAAEKEKKEDKKGKKKESKKKGGFFKPGVFKQIKAEQVRETEEAELEEANKPKKGKRKAEGEKSQESAPDKEKKPKTKEGGDKPTGEQRPKKIRAPKEGETEENKENVLEGEDGDKPKRASGAFRGGRGGGRGGSFAPRKPREYVAPPSGPYEPASLDDMLTAISSFYGTSATPKKSFFSDIPRPALFKILRSLPLKDLLKLTLVNHFLLKTISKDDKLWRLLCERDFKLKFSSDKKDEKKRFRQVYVDEYKKTKQPKQPKPVAEVVA